MKIIKENNEWIISERENSNYFNKIKELYNSSRLKLAGARLVLFRGFLTKIMRYSDDMFVMDSIIDMGDNGYYTTRSNIRSLSPKFDPMTAKSHKIPKLYSFFANDFGFNKVPENKEEAKKMIKDFISKNKSSLITIPEK